MIMKRRASFAIIVQPSSHREGLTMRVYDPAKGRLAGTAAMDALSAALDKIGAQPGDTVRITLSLRAAGAA